MIKNNKVISNYDFIEDDFENITLKPKENSGINHDFSLIFIHGLGDSANGLKDLFYPGNSIVPANCKIILPTAPKRQVTINNGEIMTSWYDIKGRNLKKSSKV